MAREMKDSGVEWIGEIPKEWGIMRIKHVAEFEPKCNMSELNNDSIVTYLPMECLKNGYFERREHNLGDLPASLTHFQENDIVIAKVTPCFENGNIAIMQKLQSGFGVGSSELFVLRCKKINIHYLFWWLQNKGFVSQACSTMTGTGGLKRISPYFIKNCAIHMPPELEQVRISNFLHVKCVELDNVLKKTRVSIEEYKKLKQAVITQTVTKGIRGDREMKDSGIDWIGEIPVEWEVSQVKYSLKWKSEKGQPQEKVLSLYRDHGIVPKDSRDDNHNVTSLDTSGYKVVDIGDFVINKMKAWQGSMAVSEYSGIISPAYHVCKFVNDKLNKKYFHYLMRNKSYIPEYTRLSTGMRVGQWDLGFDDFKNIPFLLPPQEEQQEIVNYLDEKCSVIDDLIVKKEQYLSEIENYKKSLIYEYVTGKREVVESNKNMEYNK